VPTVSTLAGAERAAAESRAACMRGVSSWVLDARSNYSDRGGKGSG
jgi:hypothetical protein